MEKIITLNANTSLLRNRPDLFLAAEEGIRDVIKFQGFEPVILTDTFEAVTAIDEAEYFSYDPSRQQCNLPIYFDSLVSKFPRILENRPDYILTDQDLFEEGLNFALGYTLNPEQISIQSIARIVGAGIIDRKADSPLRQAIATRHIARHEYSHMAGMNYSGAYENPDLREGIYAGHCNNICTMRQVDSAEEAISLSEHLHYRGIGLAGFCGSCVAKLRENARSEKFKR